MVPKTIRLVGDVHSDTKCILRMAEEADKYDLTIFLGDVDFGFGIEEIFKVVDSDRVKVLFGNHDNYEVLSQFEHNLGRFGILSDRVFFVGGAFSIDYESRTFGYDMWIDEQLSMLECNACLDLYEKFEGDIVISHDCPSICFERLKAKMREPTMTTRLLDYMMDIRAPREWYFGHHHKTWRSRVGETVFHCLNRCETVRLELL